MARATALYQYLHRLAEGWEYARDSDMEFANSLFQQLEEEVRNLGGCWIPEPARDLIARARRELDRASEARSELRMRHLESAEEAIASLVKCLPASA
jgi:hypothetical protein